MIQFITKAILSLLLLILPVTCFAHNAIGYKPERTMKNLQEIEKYFYDNYALKLKNDVTVYVTKSHKEYRDILIRCNVQNAKHIAETSYAVTSKTNTILIDGSMLSDKHFYFILAHEMVHRYQFENLPDPHADYVLLEGHADVIAEKISNYDINITDHRIAHESLKTRKQFFQACKNNPEEILEQIRYYASKTPFLPKEENKETI